MTSYSTIAEAMSVGIPVANRGVDVGFDGYRFCVEILLPSTKNSLVGVARVGEGVVASWQWHDLTNRCRGVQWRRGGDEFGGRARTGVGTVTLAVDAFGDLSAWNDSPRSSFAGLGSLFRSGTVIRWGCRSATTLRANTWLPQFCGIVESWTTTTVGLRGDIYSTVTVVETTAALAKIDNNALPGLVGGGDTIVQRVQRLLDVARFPYPIHVYHTTPSDIRLQSTDMSANRLGELYLSADSAMVDVRSDQRGGIGLYEKIIFNMQGAGAPNRGFQTWREFVNAFQSLVYISDGMFPENAHFDPATVVWANDDTAIINSATVGVANQPAGTYTRTDEASVARFNALRPFSRFDLITAGGAAGTSASVHPFMAAQTVAEEKLRQANVVRRVDQVTLNHRLNHLGRPNAGIVMSLDLGTRLQVREIYQDGYQFPAGNGGAFTKLPSTRVDATGFVRALNHRITPTATGIDTWEVDIELDTFEITRSDLP